MTELLTEGGCLLQRVADVAAGHEVAGGSCELYYKEIKLLVRYKDDNAFLKLAERHFPVSLKEIFQVS